MGCAAIQIITLINDHLNFFEKSPMMLIHGRRVCKEWKNFCDAKMETEWKKLCKDFPKFPIEISPLLQGQENLSESPSIYQYEALHHFFESCGIITEKKSPMLFEKQIKRISQTYRSSRAKASVITKRTIRYHLEQIHKFSGDCRNVKQITILDLSKIDLKIVPLEINRLESLEVLHLNNNRLKSLPALHLPHLKDLSLHHNQLQFLPEFHFSKLERLSLYSNHLSSLPRLNCPLLQILSLQDNRLVSFPNFPCVQNLQMLRLTGNHFLHIHERSMKKFGNNPTLIMHQSQIDYICQTPFARLYQQILIKDDKESIELNFMQLKQEQREKIYLQLCREIDPLEAPHKEWGEAHLFSHIQRFYIAAYKVIHKKLSLPARDIHIPKHIDSLENK